jgi:hypothetical protein
MASSVSLTGDPYGARRGSACHFTDSPFGMRV